MSRLGIMARRTWRQLHWWLERRFDFKSRICVPVENLWIMLSITFCSFFWPPSLSQSVWVGLAFGAYMFFILGQVTWGIFLGGSSYYKSISQCPQTNCNFAPCDCNFQEKTCLQKGRVKSCHLQPKVGELWDCDRTLWTQ